MPGERVQCVRVEHFVDVLQVFDANLLQSYIYEPSSASMDHHIISTISKGSYACQTVSALDAEQVVA
jgi:hypothetical protein